ncbi:nuclear transport factor 2 family protein [Pigmentiphaga soli]|uniref:Nuclear transport factor 2 family protein n=1 Tax=Pigmentiphaga soli TaxID=1007095 RepID=A0ABP8GHY2_9BURK
MSPLEKAAAIVECEQTIHRFYAALDDSDFETVANTIAEDGVWHRQGKVLKGPAAVRAALAERPAGRITAHMMQNMVVDVRGPDEADVRYIALVYRYDAPPGATGPAPLDTLLSISVYRDRLKRAADGRWLIEEMRSSRRFG